VAYGAFLASLVSRDQLVEANSKLEVSRSIAEIVGPGLEGGLVQLLTAPIAIFADAVSFLLSGVLLGLIRTHEPNPLPAEQQQNIWHEIREGLRLVTDSQLLSPLAGCIGTLSLFNSALETVFTLYVARELKIAPGLLGLIFASGSIGFLVGALLPGQVTRRLGLGPTIIAGALLAALSDLLTPLASGSIVIITLLLTIAQFLFGFGLTIYNVSQVSLRQTVTPEHLQGRMNATFHVLTLGVVPLGGVLGGILGELVGLRMTLIVAALGEALAVTWLLFSPLRSLRQQPERMA
jgi:predicted MFS family arabinose efflux permease